MMNFFERLLTPTAFYALTLPEYMPSTPLSLCAFIDAERSSVFQPNKFADAEDFTRCETQSVPEKQRGTWDEKYARRA